ncbi:MAG: aldehyde ferredoxin oxidoreductase [Bdellovibrionales bacterium RIFOXYB1_FULL_37_110]|nr:MAG: aldehyde ferredoxin oxidoreductase [Bdellovibrionales bacterium RIFOXYC1_FULL_37_79]OFZ58932.1 MAG: aldehyde ferredoxin oxidoreductase [Bdellovibrionales bacterium RIFOXYB1_FULL_37_110]OFZ64622.1 MAG: aldehyde ferredoxin oxidoreductase [Bdellovibrionales bacterium RIFOXYD1_FULL_36_51]
MENTIRVLHVDCTTGFYKHTRYQVGEYFGPIDLGLHLAGKYQTLNIGTGLLAGSILPGSNRLFFTGFSPCWGGFYISSMGGAGLVFDNLGINMLCLRGKSSTPSILYLNRLHGEEIQVQIHPIDNLEAIWHQDKSGVYALQEHVLNLFKDKYPNDPRILCTGPASALTDFGAICSAPIKKGKITSFDTWAGRGGFGSKLFRENQIAAIIYGGTFIDDDLRDRQVVDEWFIQKYNKKLSAKDVEGTIKYRYDPQFNTGGTFGVNYTTLKGKILFKNYNSIYLDETKREEIHKKLIVDHYLKQFNEDTIATKSHGTCGEPCVAVCKKTKGPYKKDYEPYQTLGPLCCIFDQNAAEKLNHHVDSMGFDAISAGGVLAWLLDCIDKNILTPAELGISGRPQFDLENFDIIKDSLHNCNLAIELVDSILRKNGGIDLSQGARKFGRKLSKQKGINILDHFLFTANARNGWMVPNQYWTPGVLSPMPIMGKYYNFYGYEYMPPRVLGQVNADRMIKEIMVDNAGMCRFHRTWAENMMPEIIDKLFQKGEEYKKRARETASRINGRNSSSLWESQLNINFIIAYLKRQKEVEKVSSVDLDNWIKKFNDNPKEASIEYWFEIRKGIHEVLVEYN